jgi:hypothetical protein
MAGAPPHATDRSKAGMSVALFSNPNHSHHDRPESGRRRGLFTADVLEVAVVLGTSNPYTYEAR